MRAWRRWLGGALCAGVLVMLGIARLGLPGSPGLTREALERLGDSGVTNPVTAALLNFRGYDTLLEVIVLLLAVVGVWSLPGAPASRSAVATHPALPPLLRWVLPVLILAAGHLLWLGSFAPGGAFQGGALLGGAVVLLLLAGAGGAALRRALAVGPVVGPTVFLAVAAGVMARTGGLLQYPPAQAGAWILVIEAAALVSVGFTLGALFLGAHPRQDAPDEHG